MADIPAKLMPEHETQPRDPRWNRIKPKERHHGRGIVKLAALAMIGLATCAVAAGPAAAQDASGTWLRDNGSSKVKIGKCGEALCGHIVWVKDSAHSDSQGERVFYDMKPSGPGEWRGSAFNPEDGNTYSGKMVLSGDRLTTSGCVLGGLICKSIKWSRSN